MVGGGAVLAGDDKVVNNAGAIAAHSIKESNLLFGGSNSQRRRSRAGASRLQLSAGQVAAGPRIHDRSAARSRRCFANFCSRTPAFVEQIMLSEYLDCREVGASAFALVDHRPVPIDAKRC